MKKLNETKQIMDMWRQNFIPKNTSLLNEGIYDDEGIGDSGFTTVGDARSFLTDFEERAGRGRRGFEDTYEEEHGGMSDDEFDYQASEDYGFGDNTLTICKGTPEESFCYGIISKDDSEVLLQIAGTSYGPYDDTEFDDVEVLDSSLSNIRVVLDRHNVSSVIDGSTGMYDRQPVDEWLDSADVDLEEDYYDY